MPNATLPAKLQPQEHDEVTSHLSPNERVEASLRLMILKNGIWLFGIPSWLFGITDRSIACFSDGYLSVVEIIQLLTLSFFFLGWLGLKPDENLNEHNAIALQHHPSKAYLSHPDGLFAAQSRMLELKDQHIVSQQYVLPFPYVCQIYHLLNLKHLESVHSFSLGNLRILNVSYARSTHIGGHIRFKTTLDSSVNALRIWRRHIVEADLTLHTPYTVELSIPVYGDKRITVMFNALPLSEQEHQFLVDIYTDLPWPKPLLQILLNAASSLTLLEDMPYLQHLSEKRISHLLNSRRLSDHEMMFLFKRFVELYGASIETHQLSESPAST